MCLFMEVHCVYPWWVKYKVILWIYGWDICEIALRQIPGDLTGSKSTLAQVVAWCHQEEDIAREPVLTQIYVTMVHY